MTAAVRPKVDVLDWVDPQPRQISFMQLSLRYRYLLYGGTRGCMKSRTLRRALVWRLVKWAEEGYPGVRVGLFCEDYPSLQDRQISKIKLEFPRWLGTLKSTQTDGLGFYLHEDYGGGIILLRNLDDPSKYVGAEMAGVAVDELTRNELEKFNMLRGSIRWPGLEDTFFWGATNSLGIGLVWVRQYWIERDFPIEMAALAPEFHFLQGFPKDNPFLSPEYWADLMSQPEEIRKAWVDGDWYILAGSIFSELRPHLHRLPEGPPDPRTAKVIVVDWAYEGHAVAGWFETTSAVEQVPHSHLYREYVTTSEHPALFAYHVVERSQGEGIQRVVLDSAAWGSPQDGGPSPAEQMIPVFQAAGMSLVPSTKGKDSVRHGLELLHTYFYPHRWNGPLLTIGENCKQTWLELSTLVYDEKRPGSGEPDKKQRHDCVDMVRYFAQDRPAPPKPTPEEVFAANPASRFVGDSASQQAEVDRLKRAERLRRDFPAVRDQLPRTKPRIRRTPWDRGGI